MNKFIITLMTFTLTACGGGSGGADGQSNSSASVDSNTVTSTPTKANGDTAIPENAQASDNTSETSQVEGIGSIEVDQSFDFRSNVSLQVTLGENLVSERAFVNICKQGESITNADNCFLRAPLDSSGFSAQIQLPHAEQKLKAEIWFYSTTKEPLVYSWELDASQQDQSWLIN
ncbi:hypothetical protein [Pseudoalteromonas sp. Of7M-16]|uniref:hypothetical protein n=1 Tax=Pseudoalteromonas sp. Of7M-16 TaxID=2917756 RepID=UPI001EF54929|nr:hypothetical protein [Pseudoalteromonas sp. Of7M-16]MCG7546833.1 hypothetical protein [Pseudoalteromonas sp. Of7M-16]